MPFRDRLEAGRLLAARLTGRVDPDAVVLGLPRGGVVVAAQVARALHAPLDVAVVRKLPSPGEPELALGAVGEGGIRIVSRPLVEEAGLDDEALERIISEQSDEAMRELDRYRAVRKPEPLQGLTAIVVDDGLTTGATASAAIEVATARGSSRVLVAVPVGPRETVDSLRAEADDVVCLETPPLLLSLDEWYLDFPAVTDEEVLALLDDAAG